MVIHNQTQKHKAFLNLEQKSSFWRKNEAKYQLAVHYETGQTQIAKNYREARKLYMELLKVEDWRGKVSYRLSKMASNQEERRKWLEEAKRGGSTDAIWELSRITTDAIRKKALLESSSSLNDYRAMMDLAEMEFNQIGVTMNDLERAEALIEESLLNGASEHEVSQRRSKIEQKKASTWEAEKQKRSVLDHIHHLQAQDPWNKRPETCAKITQSALEFLTLCSPHTSRAEFDRIKRYFPMLHHEARVSLPFNKKVIERCTEFNLPHQLEMLLNSLFKSCGAECLPALNLHKYLRIAMEKAQHEIVEYLLQPFLGLDPRVETRFGIFWAAKNNHVRLMRVLLRDKRLDPSAGNDKSIVVASEEGHCDIVCDLLKDRRVDPGKQHSYALRIAAKRGWSNIVEQMLNHEKVDPIYNADYKDVIGRGALQWASEFGHVKIVQLLLADKRALAAAEHNYAIRMAAKNGHAEICRLLITLRRSVDAGTHNQFPLRQAVNGGHSEVVEVLLKEAASQVDPSFNDYEVYKVSIKDLNLTTLKLLLNFKKPPGEVLWQSMGELQQKMGESTSSSVNEDDENEDGDSSDSEETSVDQESDADDDEQVPQSKPTPQRMLEFLRNFLE
eukprot:CAMPEP_0117439972 /NCGR_PEP_ID=MMETSP0759-20121206/2836_1 /TAXON_ID=63605 /ORGANISM="Percolomonas cosmopolitus, Strain WS" /LENGTH=616 /DNA_ID=CAMNT_0005231695 /DNA_START=97 /DNA_END=1947 /DNA_ORIENTATION=+